MTVLSRVLALAVAVALVLGALALRASRDTPGDDDATTDGATTRGAPPLTCPEELAQPCAAAAAASGSAPWPSAAEIADRLATTSDEVALLPAAWVDVVDDERDRDGLAPLHRSEVVASTPLLVVAFADRAVVLADACGIDVRGLGWACVGEHVGERWEDLGGDLRWGDVRVGHLPPSSATGLQATAGVVAARTGLPFSLAELRDVGVASWLRRVERAVDTFDPPGGSFPAGMVSQGPSVANVATATEAELSLRDLTTPFGPLEVSVPDPLFVVELVVTGADEAAVDTAAAGLDATPFAEAGWRLEPATPPPGAPVADVGPPARTPSGGVLTAVRGAWEDAVG